MRIDNNNSEINYLNSCRNDPNCIWYKWPSSSTSTFATPSGGNDDDSLTDRIIEEEIGDIDTGEPPTIPPPLPPSTSPLPPSTDDDVVVCEGEIAIIVGTAGDDELVGSESRDVIAGLGGNDRINGLGGDDLICGGDGNDALFGGALMMTSSMVVPVPIVVTVDQASIARLI